LLTTRKARTARFALVLANYRVEPAVQIRWLNKIKKSGIKPDFLISGSPRLTTFELLYRCMRQKFKKTWMRWKNL